MKRRNAFTIVELIVALSVTSILVVLMLNVFSESSTVWQRNDEKLDTFREARAALQVIARDLAAVAPIPRTEAALDSTGKPISDPLVDFPVLALEAHPDGVPEDSVNQEIYALTGARNQGHGNLCAVGYFCAWDEKRTAFVLRRQFTDSDATFSHLQTAFGAPSTAPPGAAPALTGMEAFKTLFARTIDSKDPLVASQSVEDLACYVWDLKVEVSPTTPGATAPQWPQGFYCRELPQWVEVRFKALGSTAVRKLQGRKVTRDTWVDRKARDYEHFILPGEQQFVTRVKLCR